MMKLGDKINIKGNGQLSKDLQRISSFKKANQNFFNYFEKLIELNNKSKTRNKFLNNLESFLYTNSFLTQPQMDAVKGNFPSIKRFESEVERRELVNTTLKILNEFTIKKEEKIVLNKIKLNFNKYQNLDNKLFEILSKIEIKYVKTSKCKYLLMSQSKKYEKKARNKFLSNRFSKT